MHNIFKAILLAAVLSFVITVCAEKSTTHEVKILDQKIETVMLFDSTEDY